MKKIVLMICCLGMVHVLAAQDGPQAPAVDACKLHALPSPEGMSKKYILVDPQHNIELILFEDGTFSLKEVDMQTHKTEISVGEWKGQKDRVQLRSDEEQFEKFIEAQSDQAKEMYVFKELKDTWTFDEEFMYRCPVEKEENEKKD